MTRQKQAEGVKKPRSPKNLQAIEKKQKGIEKALKKKSVKRKKEDRYKKMDDQGIFFRRHYVKSIRRNLPEDIRMSDKCINQVQDYISTDMGNLIENGNSIRNTKKEKNKLRKTLLSEDIVTAASIMKIEKDLKE